MQSQPEVKALKVPRGVTGCWDLLSERLEKLESDVHRSRPLQKCMSAGAEQWGFLLLPFRSSDPAYGCCSESRPGSISVH